LKQNRRNHSNRAKVIAKRMDTFHPRPAGIDHGTGPSDHRDDPSNHMTIGAIQ
jgi:hypothetical protein